MFIGLDLGTTALKGILVDSSQRIVATAVEKIPTIFGRSGEAEQDPSNWIDAAIKVFRILQSTAPSEFEKTEAIGLSGQMHSLVALDDAKTPLRPAILWNDVRGDEWCRRIQETDIPVASITGVRPMSSFTAAKLGWMRDNERELFRRARHVLLPKDYLRLWLTGELATDPSDAAGTQLFDQRERTWSTQILDTLELPVDVMPTILEGHEVSGNLREALAVTLNLNKVPVVCGGGDGATSSVGAGCINAGNSMLSLGTGAVFLYSHDTYRSINADTIHNFAHCFSHKWYQMAGLLSVGSAVEWISRITGIETATAMAELEARQPEPSRVTFLPYLDGVRTPHANSKARGSFSGLDRAISGIDLVQAVVEGVTYSIADAENALLSAGNSPTSPILLGGGAKSLYWAQLIATVLEKPVHRVVDAEAGSALGAARLAMIGCQLGSPDEICQIPRSETVEPSGKFAGVHRQRLNEFRAMYLRSNPVGDNNVRAA